MEGQITWKGSATWTAVTDTQTSLTIGALTIDRNNPHTIYADTGEADYSLDCYYGHARPEEPLARTAFRWEGICRTGWRAAGIHVLSTHPPPGDALASHVTEGVTELLRACAESNDAAAWEQFVAHFHRAIGLTVIRTARRWGGVPQEIASDLIQETYLKLCDGKCSLLYKFSLSHPDSVEGYVKAIAANVTHDYFKSKLAMRRGAGVIEQPNEECDPPALAGSAGGVVSIERQVLLREIEQCLNESTEGATQERDRVMFWLYYQQGLSAREIAALPAIGLTDKGVESVILRLTRDVRNRLFGRKADPSYQSASDPKGLRAARSY